jgi:hypothetical protein
MASTPDSATAPDENARSSISRPRIFAPSTNSTASSLRSRSGRSGSMFLDEDPVQPTMMSISTSETCRVRGRAKTAPDSLRPRRLATVISSTHNRHRGTVHCGAEAERRSEWPTRHRHRHGDRQDVVDEQRRAATSDGDGAEVLLADDVAAAAARRVGVDGLAIAGDDDEQQHRHDDRDGHQLAERGAPDAGADTLSSTCRISSVA